MKNIVETPVVQNVVENIPKVEKVETPTPEVPPIKALLAAELTDIVAEHKKKFARELTDKETNALLKQLLYEKLVKKHKTKDPLSERKKKKKVKFKVQSPESSESSDSD